MAYLRFAPDRYNLVRPIDLTDPPTFVTDLKLEWADGAICFDAVRRAGVEVERLPDEVKGPGPDYNDLHRDHFHFDRGAFSTCR